MHGMGFAERAHGSAGARMTNRIGQATVSDYDALKAYGHSPAKAAEIVLDAKRGDFFSRGWIAVVRQARGEQPARGEVL
jgi:hypothetical protein